MRQHKHTTVNGPTGLANFNKEGLHIHKLENGWTGPGIQNGNTHFHEVIDPNNVPIISKTGKIIEIVVLPESTDLAN